MKLSDTSILLSPGYGWANDSHWMARWSRQMKSASLVEHKDYITPKKADWIGDIVLAVENAPKPVVLVGHSLGCIAIAHASSFFSAEKVKGVFFVTPSDWERDNLIPEFPNHDFREVPRGKLPYPSQLLASRNDPFMEFSKSEELASAWGASLIDAGEAGHINVDSGQGPWRANVKIANMEVIR